MLGSGVMIEEADGDETTGGRSGPIKDTQTQEARIGQRVEINNKVPEDEAIRVPKAPARRDPIPLLQHLLSLRSGVPQQVLHGQLLPLRIPNQPAAQLSASLRKEGQLYLRKWFLASLRFSLLLLYSTLDSKLGVGGQIVETVKTRQNEGERRLWH